MPCWLAVVLTGLVLCVVIVACFAWIGQQVDGEG
jgi:hypothetical protein